MNTLKFFVVLAMLMALVITLSATPVSGVVDKETYFKNEELDTSYDVASPESEGEATSSSLRGASRFLAQKRPRAAAKMTCDKYPRVCHTKGSPGPDCCRKKCVNVMTDKLNCGSCGQKCKYAEICCKGECVNPRSNNRHCGGCNNRCKKLGNKCVYGMCSYA